MIHLIKHTLILIGTPLLLALIAYKAFTLIGAPNELAAFVAGITAALAWSNIALAEITHTAPAQARQPANQPSPHAAAMAEIIANTGTMPRVQ